MLFDILVRFLDYRAFYTSEGISPLSLYLQVTPGINRPPSLFFLNDSPVFTVFLLSLLVVGSLTLTLGFRTKLVGWFCWLLLVSLNRRNIIPLNSGDSYFALVLLWANFLPWGDAFSLEAQDNSGDDNQAFSSLASFCYICQVAILYSFSAILRVGPEWQIDGSALYYVLSNDALEGPLASFLLNFGSEFLSFFTFSVLFFELLGPILLFVPSQRVRLLAVFFLVSFHLGIAGSMSIGFFPYHCIVAALALLPSNLWETQLGARFYRNGSRAFFSLRSVFARLYPEIRWMSKTQRDDRVGKIISWIPVILLLLALSFLVDDPYSSEPVSYTHLTLPTKA